LDVGMEERFVNRAMRRALNARDKGCVVCGAPPIMCDAHHLIHWIDGGPTAISNLVLLCRAHHIATHHGHWTITITGGRPHVTRPTWASPGPPPRLNRKRPPGGPGGASAPGTTGTPGGPDAPATTTADPPSDSGPPKPAPAWPHTGDIPWISAEEAARLNPWGDQPHQPTPLLPSPLQPTPAGPLTGPVADTTWQSPWGDNHDAASAGP
jgi:hypothetical protein